ncbi:MAG: hypothetical protein Fur003_0200 [Candidatus Dojkabacteria bacterium]
MLSVIITSYKEPATIAKAIKCIADSNYSGIPADFELIQVSPDEATLQAGLEAANSLKLGTKFIQLIDPHQGKPAALQLAIDQAKGDIILMTDGDVFFEKNAVAELLKPFKDTTIGGVTGQPKVLNDRNTLMGFFGHFFVYAADLRRRELFTEKRENWFTKANTFFPLSGYIYAIRKPDFKIRTTTSIEDTYISMMTFKRGLQLAYAPEAIVYTKFATSLKDYLKQRRRTISGHMELNSYPELPILPNSRGIWDELKHFIYPFKFATSLKEFFWAFLLYPLRGLTWLIVFKSKFSKKPVMSATGWERIESTK